MDVEQFLDQFSALFGVKFSQNEITDAKNLSVQQFIVQEFVPALRHILKFNLTNQNLSTVKFYYTIEHDELQLKVSSLGKVLDVSTADPELKKDLSGAMIYNLLANIMVGEEELSQWDELILHLNILYFKALLDELDILQKFGKFFYTYRRYETVIVIAILLLCVVGMGLFCLFICKIMGIHGRPVVSVSAPQRV